MLGRGSDLYKNNYLKKKEDRSWRRWASKLRKSQLRKFLGSLGNRKSANFLGLQVASTQTANLHIFLGQICQI